MDKKALLIGGVVLVLGGAIIAGTLLNNNSEQTSKNGVRLDDSVRQEIEEQNFKDFADEEKYSFCQGREEIRGEYVSFVLGSEKGDMEYVSEDISVFDKNKNKLFILGRKIKYAYSGKTQIQVADGQGTMDIEESGTTVEYYNKYNAPVRIDYNNKIINIAPERKRSDWVVVEIKSTGSLMGFTQDELDKTTGDAKVMCPSFNIGDAFISPEYINLEKDCPKDSSSLDGGFSGKFAFSCGGIDNERGIEIIKEYKQQEELQNEFDKALNLDEDDNVSNDEFESLIKEEPSDSRGVQKKLQEMREDIKSSQSN